MVYNSYKAKANAASANGSVIVGTTIEAEFLVVPYPYYWTAATGPYISARTVRHSSLLYSTGAANGVSADGQ